MNTSYFRTKMISLPLQFICCLIFSIKRQEEISSWPCKWSFSFLKHEIWLPLQSGLTFTACIVNNSFFLSHSVWLCDLSQKWIPNTEHALENEDGNFLILDGRTIELGESYSEFSINANLAGPERRYPKSFGKHLPHLWNHTSKSQSGNQYSFLSLCELEEMESIVLVSGGWRKAAFW